MLSLEHKGLARPLGFLPSCADQNKLPWKRRAAQPTAPNLTIEGEKNMAEQTLKGSCLCKSVRYEVTTPFTRFGHCYCSRCRKATGGVRSTNIAVPIAQFRWTQGENLIKRFDLPEAQSFARQICGNCNCPIPHASRDRTRAIVPAGTLDDLPPGKPSVHGHWSSRVKFIEINESELPCTD